MPAHMAYHEQWLMDLRLKKAQRLARLLASALPLDR